ncbi:hypothetical protein SU69_06935 [Thermosipho melanesiensis]|uniref:Cell division protein ZapB n=2 Tax=Thermosipho melanesiensis TaxID=46541 RepID=A6LMR6_THEM4|nr:hypothetical protein [Thermosipho melanesiensis]ABR31217.1 hypothetical protein Tmel_1370 [Thermosipho melanesiensis BI429]APT74301.1 hypothetical protein BW47_07260 [Thermosipho melanesiensis]OOC36242.1 hypothetical protein SU68_07005 [Thermosipho melanesiensis]OOC37060.1 hypothetical protein SU69_06935 [Thermosipho melanesiensis]OOC37812.1 hypothetical protein SU70_06945 [Thermosipho melanesiensis]
MEEKLKELEQLFDDLIVKYEELKKENKELWKELNAAIERANQLEQENKSLKEQVYGTFEKLMGKIKNVVEASSEINGEEEAGV